MARPNGVSASDMATPERRWMRKNARNALINATFAAERLTPFKSGQLPAKSGFYEQVIYVKGFLFSFLAS
jgi:hypothetical protein